MKRSVGLCLLGLSASGYPLTQVALRRGGRLGALVVELACLGLASRDASMVASGVPRRLRRIPRALLRLELASGVVAAVVGLEALHRGVAKDTPHSGGRHGVVLARRVALALLFGVHTIRFWIYLQPDQGRRQDHTGSQLHRLGALRHRLPPSFVRRVGIEGRRERDCLLAVARGDQRERRYRHGELLAGRGDQDGYSFLYRDALREPMRPCEDR